MKVFSASLIILFFASFVCAQKQAEIIVTSTFLRQSPDAASEKIRTLQKGETVVFEKSQETDGFYYVSVADRTIKGWIRKETIRRIADAAKPEKSTVAKPEKSAPSPKPPETVKPAPIAVSPPTVVSPSPIASPSPTATNAEPLEDDEVIRVETEEVSLKVRVVDGGNRPIRNLDQTQFKIYEDDVLQPIASLTTAQAPVINALVIDNSRSLRTQLGKIIEAGKIIVGSNLPQDESAVVRFVSRDKIEVAQDFTPDKTLLDNALDNLFVEGGPTAMIDAIYQTTKKIDAYQKSENREDVKTRALILVSDGDDRNSFYNESELLNLLRQSQVQIYAVGFVSNLNASPEADGSSRQQKAKDLLTRLARETGGKVYFPASISELPPIAADISGEIRTQYLISYTPTNETRDGAFRKIKVVVAEGANNEKRTAISRTGRTVAPK